MRERAAGKLFIISFTISILFHAGFLAGMCFMEDSFYKKQEKGLPFFYNVSLEYTLIPPQNREKTDSGDNSKKALKKIEPEQPGGETGTKTENTPDTSPAFETSLQESASGIIIAPETGFSGENGDEYLTSLTGFPAELGNHNESNTTAAGLTREEILFKELNDKIRRNTVYPLAARKRGIEGTVTVAFVIDREGCLLESKVKKGSGSGILDKAALSVIENSLPHPHLLDRQVELLVSIIYILE